MGSSSGGRSPARIVTGILLIVLGPVVAIAVGGAGSVVGAFDVAAQSSVTIPGEAIHVSAREYVIYVPRDREAACTVENSGGEELVIQDVSRQQTNVRQQPYVGVQGFEAERPMDVVVQCPNLSADTEILVSPPVVSAGTFGGLLSGVAAAVIFVVAGVIVLVTKGSNKKTGSEGVL